MDIQGKKILVLGGGCSGTAAVCLAQTKGALVTLLDTSESAEVAARLAPLKAGGVQVFTGKNALFWNGKADLVVYSPGIPNGSPLDKIGKSTGAPCWSELAFGAAFLNTPLLAVTGTNGKTTTTEMLQHCLNAGGKRSIAAGNIGLPLSDVALSPKKYDFIVTEVSSFQMEHPGAFTPRAAALLNVTPDHLDRHGSMENYTAAKLCIFANFPETLIPVVNAALLRDNPQVAQAFHGKKRITFSADPQLEADFTIRDGNLCRVLRTGKVISLLSLERLPWKGIHNYENALAALATIEAAGLDPLDYALFLVTFQIGPHKIQTVAQKGNIRYIDDSKATDVDALIRALQTIGTPGIADIALIAGGLDKGCDMLEALPHLKQYVKHLFLIGQCRQRLAQSWGEQIPFTLCNDMQEAVAKATALLSNNGGTVLLSPACASMDMFKSYADRGNQFQKAIP